MSTCQGCGGIVGRDCFNPQECLWISQDQQRRAAEQQAPVCRHRIADARNQYVESGYPCIDCGAVFAAAGHAPLAPTPAAAEGQAGVPTVDEADERIRFAEWAGNPPVEMRDVKKDPTSFWCWEAWQAALGMSPSVRGPSFAAPLPRQAAVHGEAIYQWRRRDVDMWHDTTKEDAYSRIDATYEARTVYLAAPQTAPDQAKSAPATTEKGKT